MRKQQATVSAGGIVVRSRGHAVELLIVMRTTNVEPKWAPILRQLPKGSKQDGETLQQAAVREVFEETGYLADLLHKAGTARWQYERADVKWTETVHYFFMRPKSEAPEAHDDEFDQVLWIPLDDAPGVLSYPEERSLIASLLREGDIPT